MTTDELVNEVLTDEQVKNCEFSTPNGTRTVDIYYKDGSHGWMYEKNGQWVRPFDNATCLPDRREITMPSLNFTLINDYIPNKNSSLWGLELDFNIEADMSLYDPGNTCGPPENCYPPEGGEIDITGIELIDKRYIGKEATLFQITKEFKDMLEKSFMDLINSNDKLREKIEEELFKYSGNNSHYHFDNYPDYG
jgi:hypothetical protein